MFFRLNSEIVHLHGTKQSVLYNMISGSKQYLNPLQSKIVDIMQTNTTLEELQGVYHEKVIELIDILKRNKAGSLYKGNVVIPKIKVHNPNLIERDILKPFHLDRVVIELTGKCNLNCKYCKEENIVYRSCGCKKWTTCVEKELNLDKWEAIVQDTISLGVKQAIFSGGEPLMYWNTLKHLIILFTNSNVKCTILTNGTLINSKMALFLKEYSVNLVFQVFDCTEEDYTNTTKEPWSYNAFINGLKIIERNKIDHSISLVVSVFNQDRLDEIRTFFKGKKINLMYLYPTNEFYPNKLLNRLLDPEEREIPVNLYNYQILEKYHNCLYGQIFISAEGKIYPCMMMRQEELGNVFEEPLYKIFNQQRHKKFWNTPKKNVHYCDNCARSLFCFDCRALDAFATQDYQGMKYCNKITRKE